MSYSETANDPGVAAVTALLNRYGIEVQIMPSDTSTAVAAAHALGTDVASIVKSLVFMHDSTPILALVAGNRTAVKERLANALGVNAVRLARPAEVLAETGYAIGGVPPVAHRTSMRVLMDRHLASLPVIYAAAGSRVAVFKTTPQELQQLAHAELTDFAE